MKRICLFLLSAIVAVFFCAAIFSACEEEKAEHVHFARRAECDGSDVLCGREYRALVL